MDVYESPQEEIRQTIQEIDQLIEEIYPYDMINTLENATERIIEGLQELAISAKEPLKPQPANQKRSMTITPIHKRVDQIIGQKQQWLETQQEQKRKEERQQQSKYSSRQTVSSEGTLDQFIENQKNWLKRKNENLISQRLQKENQNQSKDLTFKPNLYTRKIKR